MTYSIIGSGNVGTALARQFTRSGIPVSIANSRGAAITFGPGLRARRQCHRCLASKTR